MTTDRAREADGVATFALPDEAASLALGRAMAQAIAARFAGGEPGGFTIHLSGELGAGKTTIVRALLRALGVEGRVRSPTYTLVEPYEVEIATATLESRRSLKLHCYHFDFYRFEDPHEWLDAGFRDLFSDAALRLVEWPERAALSGSGDSLLPTPDWHVVLAVENDGHGGRSARIDAHGDAGRACLSALASSDRDAGAS